MAKTETWVLGYVWKQFFFNTHKYILLYFKLTTSNWTQITNRQYFVWLTIFVKGLRRLIKSANKKNRKILNVKQHKYDWFYISYTNYKLYNWFKVKNLQTQPRWLKIIKVGNGKLTFLLMFTEKGTTLAALTALEFLSLVK